MSCGSGADEHVLAPGWRCAELVASIQIKNVPDEVRLVYRRRAAAAGKSLQEYLLGELIENASRPTLDEVLDGPVTGPVAGCRLASRWSSCEPDARAGDRRRRVFTGAGIVR
ncbi:MAG: FitA-like ribbon-helix-helix domain-containing protein [Pseudonocardiaceae bacterium]